MATDVQIGVRRVISRNPATGETLREFECASASEVGAAVARARAAQSAWAELGVPARAEILRRFQRLLHQNKDDVARTITRENGKPQVEALLTEVLVVLDAARFLIENAYALLKPEPVPHGNLIMKTKSAHLIREPYGVIGIISPWNYPFSTPATEGLAALVAGNAVVIKPSEFTPLAALELASLLHQAGVPREVFQVVVGDGSAGAALVEAPIDKIIFTGSVRTGKRVAETAAGRLLPVVLELGGKDPMLVLEDADLDVATSAALWGAFMNAGQTCLSVERCYVHRSLYEKFLAGVVEKTRKLRLGNGTDPETDVGPMIHEQQLRVVEAHVADAIARGARLLAGGRRLPELGPNFYAPTVLADVTHEMLIMREETFGPVLPVMPFDHRRRGGAAGQRLRVRPGGQRLDQRSPARRSPRPPHPGGHGHGQRRDQLLRHQRSPARRRKVQRAGPRPRPPGPGGDGPHQVPGLRPAAARAQGVVVRLRRGVRAADGRVRGLAVCRELGRADQWRPAVTAGVFPEGKI